MTPKHKTIGILVTGHTPEELMDDFGTYADMFASMLGDFNFTFKRYFVVDGVFPDGPHDAEGWLVSGSKFGVYEDYAWIRQLEDFIRAVHAANVPMVGICFGHQAMAKALGGEVEKFNGGWAVGTTTYQRPDLNEEQVLLAWHQDQVVKAPAIAEVVGSNDFCQNAVLRYGDWGLSFQPHPEFSPAFYKGLIEARSSVLPPELVEKVRVISQPLSTQPVVQEIGEFLARER